MPKAIIRTPYPTAAEVAKDLGLTPHERRRADRLVQETLAEMPPNRKWPSKTRNECGSRIVYRTCPFCGEDFSNDKCLAAALNEIARLRASATEAAFTEAAFMLSPEEDKHAKAFRKQHGKKHRGGYNSWTYKFTPTGIGMKRVIECSCGVQKDVTDYEKW